MNKRFLFSVLCLCLAPLFALGDAMVVTRAMTASTIVEVYVETQEVRVELEIGMADIESFKNILPDSIYQDMGNAPEPIKTRVDRFFKEDFVLRADGQLLQGRIRQMEPRQRILRDEITGESLPVQGDGEHVLFAEFIFSWNTGAEDGDVALPQALTLQPPSNERGYASGTLGMMVYHLGVPVMDFRYLSRPETLQLDWADPWYSQFDNKNLWRQYNEPISVFLYAEPFETRVEVIVRPKDIQQWHDLGIEGMDTIPVAMQSQLKEQIAQFILTKMEVKVDGAVVVPELQRINFLKRTLKSSIVIDPPEELAANSATLGVIYSVPTATLPQAAQVTWNLFSPKMQVVRAAGTDEAGPLPYRLSPDDNVLVWQNFLKNPTIPTIEALELPMTLKRIGIPFGTVLLLLTLLPIFRQLRRAKGRAMAWGGSGAVLIVAIVISPFLLVSVSVPVSAVSALTDETSTEVVAGLLKNVYTAFDFRDEETIYDALDQSLQGDLLTEVYLQTMQSLELASQGGARVKVKAVNLESIEFEEHDAGIQAVCTWDVLGSVGHWGHIHQRVNRYVAEMIVEPVDGIWKITSLEIMEEQRIK